MRIIKATAIDYLVSNLHEPSAREELANFIDPRNNYQIIPVWYGTLVALALNDFPKFIFQLQKLMKVAIDPKISETQDWLAAFAWFFNSTEETRVPLTTGLRIPTESFCFYLAKTHLLFNLVANGDEELINSAIDKGLLNPKTLTNDYKDTMLHALAANGHLDLLLRFKQKYNLSFHAENILGASPLHHLMLGANLEHIQKVMQENLLMEIGLRIDWTDGYLNQGSDLNGATYAHYLAQSGKYEVLLAAIKKKWVSLFVKDDMGATPIHHFALSGNLYGLIMLGKYLKEYHHINLNAIKNNYLHTVWDYFAMSGNNRDLFLAAEQGLFNLKDSMDINRCTDGQTLLHFIARGGNTDGLSQEDKIACNHILDKKGNTPTHLLTILWRHGLSLEGSFDSALTNNRGFTSKSLWQASIEHNTPWKNHKKFLPDGSFTFFTIYCGRFAQLSAHSNDDSLQDKGEITSRFRETLYCDFDKLVNTTLSRGKGDLDPMNHSVGNLPEELWLIIFNDLDKRSLLFLALSCKFFYFLLQQHEDLIKQAQWPLLNYIKPKNDRTLARLNQKITTIAQLPNDNLICVIANGIHFLDGQCKIQAKLAQVPRFSLFKEAKPDMDGNGITCFLLHSKGGFISATEKGLITIYDNAREFKKDLAFHTHIIGLAEFSPKEIVCASTDGIVYLWNIDENIISPFTAHVESITALACVQGKIITGSSLGYLKVWDKTGNLLNSWQEHHDSIHGIAALGDKVVTISDDDINVWDLATGKNARINTSWGCKNRCLAVLDSNHFMIGTAEGELWLWNIPTLPDTESHFPKTTLTLKGASSAVHSLIKANNNAIIGAFADNTLRIYNFELAMKEETSVQVDSDTLGEAEDAFRDFTP